MRIASSDIRLSMFHQVEERHVRKESLVEGVSSRADAWEPSLLVDGTMIVREEEQARAFEEGTSLLDRFWEGNVPEGAQRIRAEGPEAAGVPAVGGLDDLARAIEQATAVTQAPGAREGLISDEFEPSPEDKAKIDLIVATIEGLTGKKIRLMDPKELAAQRVEPPATPEEMPPDDVAVDEGAGGAWGLRYLYQESHYEGETTHFQAEGRVRTSEGQEIAVDVALSLSREFMTQETVSLFEGAAVKDPLVINFEGTAAELTQRRFEFDIDSDGSADQIHFVKPNSGFVALDANADGAITDGSELFGPRTGDGFAELAEHDADGNNWIDENDPIYDGLRIWSKDGTGNDQLVALGARGIGAIYLGHATTPFEMRGQSNELQGVVRSSSVYLAESGSSGTVQQIDLVV